MMQTTWSLSGILAPGIAAALIALPALLEVEFPGRFYYNPSNGPDITDRLTGVKIEIGTVAQKLYKLNKYSYIPAEVATHKWNPWYKDVDPSTGWYPWQTDAGPPSP